MTQRKPTKTQKCLMNSKLLMWYYDLKFKLYLRKIKMGEIMKNNKRPYVLEWAIEISWNDGVKCFLRDSELSKESRKQINQDINSHWENAVNKNYRGDSNEMEK